MVGRLATIWRMWSRRWNTHTGFFLFHDGGRKIFPGLVSLRRGRWLKDGELMIRVCWANGRKVGYFRVSEIRYMGEYVTPKKQATERKITEGL